MVLGILETLGIIFGLIEVILNLISPTFSRPKDQIKNLSKTLLPKIFIEEASCSKEEDKVLHVLFTKF